MPLNQRLGLGSDSKPFSLEQFLGAKAFAVAGSLIVVVAVVLFLKYAYDQGWIKLISPTWRCLISAGFGVALIATGEGVRKRIGAFASSGLSATGLATLYATALVARHMFELIGAGTSFALLLLITLIGVGLGATGRRLFMMFLSLGAAYAVPFIVGAVDPSPYVFPGYLFSLLALGLLLAAALGGPFRSLRPTVWGATALLGGLWIATIEASVLWTALLFVSSVWALIHAELVLSVLLRRRSLPRSVRGTDELDRLYNWLSSVPAPSVSFSSTVWSAICMIVVVRRVDVDDQSLPVLGLAIACGVLAWRLMPSLDLLRGAVSSVRSALAVSLAFQCAALVIAAIAMYFSGNDQDLAWLVLAGAACVLGRRIDAMPLITYGLITLGILLARLVLQWGEFHADEADLFDVTTTPWVVKAIFASVVPLIAALCSERIGRGFVLTLTGISLALLMATPLLPGAEAGNIAIVWSSVAVLALIGSGGKRWLELDVFAMAIATLATLPVIAAFAFYLLDGDGRSLFVLAACLAIAVQVAMADLIRRDLIAPSLKPWHLVPVGCAVVLLAIAPLTPETDASSVALIWSGLAGLLIALAWRGRWLSLDIFAGAVGTTAAVPWIVHLLAEYREGDTLVWNATLASGGALAAVLCLVSYSLLRGPRVGLVAGEVRRGLGHGLCTLGVLMLLAATSVEAMRADGVILPSETVRAALLCIWWVAFGLIALGLARIGAIGRVRVASLSLTEIAGVMAAASALPWIAHLSMEYRADAYFALNFTLGSGAATTVGLWFVASALVHGPTSRGPGQRMAGNALGAMGAVVLLVATSIEASRAGRLYVEDDTARQAMLSIWWALYGVAGLVFGSIERMRRVRLACLILIGFAALKVVAYDLANVSPLWRIASSLALGLLMLLIGVAYARSMQRRSDEAGDGEHAGETRSDSETPD